MFAIQDIFFNVLKKGLCDAKIFKICNSTPRQKFVLIEEIKEEALNAGRRQFNIALKVFPDTFDYRVLSKMLDDVRRCCVFGAFEGLEGFVGFKLLKNFISSNLQTGYEARLEFVCFVSDLRG
jgi:hypothetical protein